MQRHDKVASQIKSGGLLASKSLSFTRTGLWAKHKDWTCLNVMRNVCFKDMEQKFTVTKAAMSFFEKLSLMAEMLTEVGIVSGGLFFLRPACTA